VLSLALVLTLASVGLSAMQAHAENFGASPYNLAVRASCTYAGQTYSHGSVIRQANGLLYRCNDGEWEVAGF
jgi:hypothetical protein